MEIGNDNFDLLKLVNVKGNIENITPHKIAVVAFIREYGLLKIEAKKMIDCTVAPKYRKDFCMLALKLIQCPDMEFKELETLLTDGRYNLLSVHLQNFCVRLQNIYVNGISALMDCVTSTYDKLMVEQSETNPCIITRYSVLGLYLRRIILQLEKLTFVQSVALYKSFCLYYQRGRPGLMMRSLSKEKLNHMEAQATTSTSPVIPEEYKPLELSMKMNIIERDNSFDEGQWSRKQAELFTAQQANLLQLNEKKALPPRQLQKAIAQIMHDIPEYSDIVIALEKSYSIFRQGTSDQENDGANTIRLGGFLYCTIFENFFFSPHFLSFLNCLRMNEFCGAQDSLYNCFDRSGLCATIGGSSDKNKNFLYAALNRAAMHAHFGHKALATEAAREAVSRAQEVCDGAAVSAASAWAALAGGRGESAGAAGAGEAARGAQARDESAPRRTRPPRHAAVAAQFSAQHKAVNGAVPAEVFQMLMKGDLHNYLHSMTDLTVAGLANTAALWALYGKTEMASVSSQLLLSLNTRCVPGGAAGAGAEGGECVCVCGAEGAAAVGAWRAQSALLCAVATHFPSPDVLTVASAAHAEAALRAGKWEEADQSIRQLASLDRWGSQLLKAEMYFLRGDATSAIDSLNDVLDFCKTEDDSLHFVSLRLRAMILMSQVQHSFSSIQSTNIMLLNEALTIAKKYHLHYLATTIEMHIANVQLNMGCAKNALILVRKVLPYVMAHGSTYDLARAMLLYTKCRIATAPINTETRMQVLQSCCDALESVKSNFSKVGAHARILQTWYLQAQLYNDIGNQASRNQCAWMFRQLEQQNPVEPSNMLLVMY